MCTWSEHAPSSPFVLLHSVWFGGGVTVPLSPAW